MATGTYEYVEAVDGSIDVMYSCREKPQTRIGVIRDRKFRRIPAEQLGFSEGRNLSLIQSTAAYKALLRNLIGPV